MRNVTILGAGMVGRAMARDLAGDFRVTSVDRDPQALGALKAEGIATRVADLADPDTVRSLAAEADAVVGAVPGFMGLESLRAVIQAGRPCVDISFFAEDPFQLSDAAEAAGVQVITDCGVAPGLSHMLLGARWGRPGLESYRCLVGGLPMERRLPWQYKAPFSPIDVLEEYTRPARLRRGGLNIELPALSESELVDLAPLGSLEAVNTDGLRSLLETMPLPEMVEKTLRYPGHYDRVRALKEDGFLDTEPLALGETRVRPLELAAALLLPAWKLEEDEDECTVMRVEITSIEKGRRVTERWDLFDRRDARGVSSMSRTTGYTCTCTLRALAEGLFRRQGLSTPEYVGAEQAAFARITALLEQRGIRLDHSIEETPAT